MTTTLVDEDDKIFAIGTCPDCKHSYKYDVSSKEKLSEIAVHIGPRVDTSQAVFQDLLNIRLRISGPGEIAYYTQAATAVESIGYKLPIFVKYTRAFYNSPWIEKLGKTLHQRNQGSLQQARLFDILRMRVNAEKEDDGAKVQDAEDQMFDLEDMG